MHEQIKEIPQEKSPEQLPNDDYEITAEKFRKIGPLGVTAKDHKKIGSTPPDFMIENPNKTMGELMTNEQIEKWITKNSMNKARDQGYYEKIKHERK